MIADGPNSFLQIVDGTICTIQSTEKPIFGGLTKLTNDGVINWKLNGDEFVFGPLADADGLVNIRYLQDNSPKIFSLPITKTPIAFSDMCKKIQAQLPKEAKVFFNEEELEALTNEDTKKSAAAQP